MRKTVWMVLFCLTGAAPVAAREAGARSEGAEEVRSPETVSNEVLQQQVNELWTTVRRLEARIDVLERALPAGEPPAVGGGGAAGEAVPGVPVASTLFVGRVRAVTDKRVQVVDSRGNVYALIIDEKTRVFGPDGARMPVQALREDLPVRTSLVLISGRNHARDIRVMDPEEVR